MAKIIDITSRIKDEKKAVTFNGKEYPVNDSKNAVLEVMGLMDGDDVDPATIDKAMRIFYGDEAVADFEGLSFSNYMIPFIAALALATGKDYEELEASFRNSIG